MINQNFGGWPNENYTGKGPKDFKRADERIYEDIGMVLTNDPFIDPSNVSVDVKDGEVTFTGTVSNIGDRARLDQLFYIVFGIKTINNRVEIRDEKSYREGEKK